MKKPRPRTRKPQRRRSHWQAAAAAMPAMPAKTTQPTQPKPQPRKEQVKV